MKILLFFAFIFFLYSCKVTKTTPIVQRGCDDLFFNIDTGMISSVSPMLPATDIREWFPCYTHITPDGASRDCGGGVFYKNHGFVYYTFWDYIEVDSSFKGKISYDLMSLNRENVNNILGEPGSYPFNNDYPHMDFYEKEYGCLVLKYKNGNITKVAAYATDCNSLVICE